MATLDSAFLDKFPHLDLGVRFDGNAQLERRSRPLGTDPNSRLQTRGSAGQSDHLSPWVGIIEACVVVASRSDRHRIRSASNVYFCGERKFATADVQERISITWPQLDRSFPEFLLAKSRTHGLLCAGTGL